MKSHDILEHRKEKKPRKEVAGQDPLLLSSRATRSFENKYINLYEFTNTIEIDKVSQIIKYTCAQCKV